MNLFNIGVEGQYRVGAFAAAVVRRRGLASRLAQHGRSPSWSRWSSGALWAGIAGVLRVTRGVSEVISTIMLNAIAVSLVGYLLQQVRRHEGRHRPATKQIPEGELGRRASRSSATRPSRVYGAGAAGGRSSAWRSAFVLNRTRFGFDLRATGQSETAAVASGVNVKRMVVVSMLLSGARRRADRDAACSSATPTTTAPTFQTGLGFAGIAVALLGRNNPIGIAFGALLFAFLNEQSQPAQHPGRHLARHRRGHPGHHRARRRHRLRGRPPLPRPARAAPRAPSSWPQPTRRGGAGMSVVVTPARPPRAAAAAPAPASRSRSSGLDRCSSWSCSSVVRVDHRRRRHRLDGHPARGPDRGLPDPAGRSRRPVVASAPASSTSASRA